MKRTGILLMLLAGAIGATSSLASGHHKKGLPPCEPGFQWVEVTEYKEVCRDVCKIVPDVKKTTKWVYSQIDDPFCIKRTGHTGHGHLLGHHDKCTEGCPTCEGPYCRKLLVKKEVVCEEPTTKCVVEKIVEKVPCTVLRKVPCTTTTVPEVIQAPKEKGTP